MRKRLCALMMTLVLCLSACGGAGENKVEELALDIRAKYLSMAGCTAVLDITADYGDRMFQCVLAMDHTAGGETVLTVVEPELLEGVTARLQNGESLLEFDGICLDTGPVSPNGLSPLDCVPFLLKEIQEGFISQWGVETLEESECLRFTTADPDEEAGEGTQTSLWFDQESGALLKGEITVDGYSVLRCEVSDFMWKEKEA